MELEDLPEDVIIIILKKLDLKSIKNLYDACIPHIKNVIICSGYMKKCDISLSTLATINTLKTSFFMDISTNLREIDLKGVEDLTVEALLPALKRTVNLVALNVAYTNITIFDFLQIYDYCQSIKEICIDFQSMRDYQNRSSILPEEVFAKMEKVHFVGSQKDLLWSGEPEFILRHAKLNSLTYTLAKESYVPFNYNYSDRKPSSSPCMLNNLNILIPTWRTVAYQFNFCLPPLVRCFEECEFILIKMSQFRVVCCSPAFKSFLESNFGQQAKVYSDLKQYPPYDFITACLIWNKRTTTIDETFLKQLKTKIAPLFPCKLQSDNHHEEGFSDPGEEIPITSDMLWLTYEGLMCMNNNSKSGPAKRKKHNYVNFNCDKLAQDKHNLELSISRSENEPLVLTLSWNSHFLQKLSFLSLLYGVEYSPNFFKVLFRYAKNLKTFNIEFEELSIRRPSDEYLLQISKYIWLSKSLKNLRIQVRQFNFTKVMNRYLCHCKSLENVILCDSSTNPAYSIGNPEVFIKYCDNLYYLRIEAWMDECYRAMYLEFLNKVKVCCRRPYLKIDFVSGYSYKYSYDPFIDVFKLSKIRSINF